MTRALTRLNLQIASAHVTTYGERAVDVFYVTDLLGKQIISDLRQNAVRARLKSILDPECTNSASETAGA